MQTRLDPANDCCEGPHRPVELGPLLVARGQAPVVLHQTDQPFDLVAQAILRLVEGATPTFVASPRNRNPYAAPPEVEPIGQAAVGLVAHDTLRTQSGPTTSSSPDGTLLHQAHEGRVLVPLARRQYERDRLALALRSQMDLCRKATLTSPEGFPPGRFGGADVGIPFFAPAAC